MAQPTRAPRKARRSVNKPWTSAEDDALRSLVNTHSEASWSVISKYMPNRDSKSCRHRWFNELRPGISKVRSAIHIASSVASLLGNPKDRPHWLRPDRHLVCSVGPITPDFRPAFYNVLLLEIEALEPFTNWEDAVIIRARLGDNNTWTYISSLLPGRTNNAVKNRWNCTLKRLLRDGDVPGSRAVTANEYLASGMTLEDLLLLHGQSLPLDKRGVPPQPASGNFCDFLSEESGSSPSYSPMGKSPVCDSKAQCHDSLQQNLSDYRLDPWCDAAMINNIAGLVPDLEDSLSKQEESSIYVDSDMKGQVGFAGQWAARKGIGTNLIPTPVQNRSITNSDFYFQQEFRPVPPLRGTLSQQMIAERYRSSCGSVFSVFSMPSTDFSPIVMLETEASNVFLGPEMTCSMKWQ
eukprot:scaffold222336_cov47-Prasinocladus_malaysianus.AAC.1